MSKTKDREKKITALIRKGETQINNKVVVLNNVVSNAIVSMLNSLLMDGIDVNNDEILKSTVRLINDTLRLALAMNLGVGIDIEPMTQDDMITGAIKSSVKRIVEDAAKNGQ